MLNSNHGTTLIDILFAGALCFILGMAFAVLVLERAA